QGTESPAQTAKLLQALQASNGAATPAALAAAGQPPAAPPGAAPNAPNDGNPQDTNMPASPSSQEEPAMSAEDKTRLKDLMTLIRSRNPYQLSHDGALTLPGFEPIPLLGLTEEQASLRLQIEPAFRGVEIRLTRLPLKKTGPLGLKPFGYDLFKEAPSTFAPVTNVPVPSDYVIGAGDELSIQLYGSQNRTLKLTVGRDGRIAFPELGPISVAGLVFSKAKADIESRVEHQLIGVRASVAMADTRSIRVFVLGEARRPGSYTISGLGTITSALFAAGGVKRIGSLRRIELKRQGTVVRKLDVYDLLIRGDTTDDAKLLQGDVIFVPPVGPTVSVYGEVRRPAIYEIKNESTVADVVQLAGGLTPQADPVTAMLTRIDANQHRVVLQADILGQDRSRALVRNGDELRVTRLRPTLDSAVVLQGHVFTAGAFPYHEGMHISDVIHSTDELRPDADLHYVLIRRELPPDRRVAVLSVDLAAAWRSPRSNQDIVLMPRDRITVFDLSSGRDKIIQPLMDELRRQSSAMQPAEVVHVEGKVKVPGEYPLQPGMTVVDLIRAGGGLADAAAYGGTAELTRYRVEKGETRQVQLVNVDLTAALHGDPSQNLKLEPFDDLSVKQVSQWDVQESVLLRGEVRFPGRYIIRNGDTLRGVIARAGGLTSFAFPEGSVFTRETLKELEQKQMDMLATRMQTALTGLAIRGAAAGVGGGASALTLGQSLLGQLRSAKAVGRLVIDLPRLMREPPGSADDVILRNGDLLIVPKFQQQVTVIGEVQSATSHLYRRGLGRDEYIALSGGLTRDADKRKIYVVRANGSVVARNGNRWFRGTDVAIKPGDTIVVPLDTERMPPLPFWQAVTGILYNVALGAAAIRVL
ncbi:MAG TPA: SLBB domain-containing protein, partial [Steroidobacteraceae bacterium]|nr:SLBB domain-containing protein [Steroidobacteraceae bacterium]